MYSTQAIPDSAVTSDSSNIPLQHRHKQHQPRDDASKQTTDSTDHQASDITSRRASDSIEDQCQLGACSCYSCAGEGRIGNEQGTGFDGCVDAPG